MSDLQIYLLKFTLISIAVLGGLWGLRWYITHKYSPGKTRPLIRVVERTFLAPGRQGVVVDVDGQRFFLVLSDKHSSITELNTADFTETLQEEVENGSDK